MTFVEIVQWRKEEKWKNNLYRAISIATIGIFPFVCFYFPIIKTYFISTVSNPLEADIAIMKVTNDKNKTSTRAYSINSYRNRKTKEHAVVIEVETIRYCASSLDHYKAIPVPDAPHQFARFLSPDYRHHSRSRDFAEEFRIFQVQYGENKLTLPQATLLEIILHLMFSPFYVFQYFATIVWYLEDYSLYATLILVITLTSIGLTARETLFNINSLHKLAGNSIELDLVKEGKHVRFNSIGDDEDLIIGSPMASGDIKRVFDYTLLPGDKFLLSPNMILPCDALLLSGKVIVDESMLTGEAIPVNKTSLEINPSMARVMEQTLPLKKCSTYLPSSSYDNTDINSGDNNCSNGNNEELEKSSHVLVGGTKIIACFGGSSSSPCVAICYKTGFRSAKGQLIATLLTPKEGMVTFIADAMYVLLCMCILATILYLFIAITLIEKGLDAWSILLHYLDAITIAVPPALTACLTVSTSIALDRLKHRDIFVTDTTRINFAGMISSVSFDKTGTLTENTLHLCKISWIIPNTSSNSNSNGLMFDEYDLEDEDETNQKQEEANNLPLLCQEILATCHSLTYLNETQVPIGDPLELELFIRSKWQLKRSSSQEGILLVQPRSSSSSLPSIKEERECYTIIKHFDFTPEKLRSGCLIQEPLSLSGGQRKYLCKGSPEIIAQLVHPASIPVNFHSYVNHLTKSGYRVIAMAGKTCSFSASSSSSNSNNNMIGTQEELEQDMQLLGLLALSSSLKTDTKQTIAALKHACIHVNMITGDHINTAISISKQCGLIKDVRHIHHTHLASSSSSLPLTLSSPPKLIESKLTALTNTITTNSMSMDLENDMVTISLQANNNTTTGSANNTSPKANDNANAPTITVNNNAIVQNNATSSDRIRRFLFIIEVATIITNGGSVEKLQVLNSATDQVVDIPMPFVVYLAHLSLSFTMLAKQYPKADIYSYITQQDATAAVNPLLLQSNTTLRSLILVDLAITGKALALAKSLYSPRFVRYLIRCTKVFARMKPQDKQMVIQSLLQSKEYDENMYTCFLEALEEEQQSSQTEVLDAQTYQIMIEKMEQSKVLLASSSPSFSGQSIIAKLKLILSSMVSKKKKHHHQHHHELVGVEMKMKKKQTKSNKSKKQKKKAQKKLRQLSPQRRTRDGHERLQILELEDEEEDEEDEEVANANANEDIIGEQRRSNKIQTQPQSQQIEEDDNDNSDNEDNEEVMYTSFVGDGANDVLALQAANVGISLCDTETSVAASVTSKQASPYAIIAMLIEGRCSLITAYVLITFNIYYAVIQLVLVLLVYSYGLAIGNNKYMLQDIGYTLILGVVISYTQGMQDSISASLPPQRYLIFYFLFRLIVMIIIFIVFQVFTLYILSQQTSFYTSYVLSEHEELLTNEYSYENTTIFLVSCGQLMIASIISCMGYPFRQAWYTNQYHIITLIIQFLVLLLLLFLPDNVFFAEVLMLVHLPASFAGILVTLMLFNAIICAIASMLIDSYFGYLLHVRWFHNLDMRSVMHLLISMDELIDEHGFLRIHSLSHYV